MGIAGRSEREDELLDIAVITPFSLTFTEAADKPAWTPGQDKTIQLKFISFESNADVAVGWRFGNTVGINVCRLTKGPYVANLVGCNVKGAKDQVLNIRAEGAVTVKGYFLGKEL